MHVFLYFDYIAPLSLRLAHNDSKVSLEDYPKKSIMTLKQLSSNAIKPSYQSSFFFENIAKRVNIPIFQSMLDMFDPLTL